MATDPFFTFLRGQRIEEMSRADLIALHDQITRELPEKADELCNADVGRLYEIESIEDELNRRYQRMS